MNVTGVAGRVPDRAQAVIIGGGVAGCSVANHLARAGWTDIVLLERKRLTSGTTWHAAGLIGQLRGNANMTRLAKYSVDLYTRLEAETGVATGFRQVGSISAALTADRHHELMRAATTARAFDVQEVSPSEVKTMYPHLDVDGVVGGVHLPMDGQADPANIAMALAKGARMRGAQVLEGVKVTGVTRVGGRVTGLDWQAGEGRGHIAADACGFLQRVCANDVDVAEGRIVYTRMLNDRGGIEADVTVTRLSETAFLVVTAGANLHRDLAWLRRHVGEDFAVVTDVTSAEAVLCLMGPRAREVLARISPGRLDNDAFPFGTAKEIELGLGLGRAHRVTCVGELGWELYVPTDQAAHVFEALSEAAPDVTLCGLHALDSCRIEKGFRHFGHDITDEDHVLEAGLGFAVKPGEGAFIGREAVLARSAEGLRRRLVQFRLEDPEPMLFHNEGIVRDGRIVGTITSGNYGHALGGAVGLGWVPCAGESAGAVLASRYEIEVAERAAPLPEGMRSVRAGMPGGQYRPLTESGMAQIHAAALDALEVIGFGNAPPSGVNILTGAGAILGDDGRIRFPRALVEDMLAKAARGITLYGREARHDLHLTGTNVHFGTAGAAVHIVDVERKEYRDSTVQDLFDAARITHGLDNVRFLQRAMVCRDVLDNFDMDINTLYACLAGTTKHVGTSFSDPSHVAGCFDLLRIVAGGEEAWRARPLGARAVQGSLQERRVRS